MTRITYIPNRVIDTNGIADGAAVYVYQAGGTTTTVPLFSDPDYTTPVTNPYVVPSGAAVPALFTSYENDIRVRVVSAKGTVVMDEDPYFVPANRQELISVTGASSIGIMPRGTVADAIHWVTPEMFGAEGDGITDDTTAVQSAINYLESQGGGTLMLGALYLVGGLIVTGEHIVFQGTCREHGFLVKHGTLGVHVQVSWVHFRHMKVWSQGTETDGLNTRGILYSKGSGSTGHVFIYDVNIQNFSGYGMEVRNTLDFVIQSSFFRDCKTGFQARREGTGPSDFSTTIQFIMVYAISCDIGIDLERIRHSRFSHVICEWNRIGILSNISDFTTNRCYFENNTERGIDAINSQVVEVDNYYNNPASDGIVRTYSGGAILPSDRWYRKSDKGLEIVKQLGLTSRYAVDPIPLSGVGTTSNIGLKYGEAIVPRVHGDDLLDQSAWTSITTSEFSGWVPTQKGYLISHGSSGVRGMQQTVTLSNSETYILEFSARNVGGLPLETPQVGGVARTPGVPFTVASSGPTIVRVFRNQAGASENYVDVFRLYRVLEDQSYIAKTTDILSRMPSQRGELFGTAAPSSGTWAIGERVWNSAPVAGTVGWVCTASGTPGTWVPFG